jgi:tRNA nucleotidyltransferase (CCA-adding enzyme)
MAAERPITIPDPVVRILRRLEDAGHETWCVGGAIRDALLGNPQQDVDLATAAPPEVVRSLFRRTVAVGIEHGTVGVLDEQGVLHEVTTFRRDVQSDGRHAIVEFGVSLDEDLARRDFTINAIAWHPIRLVWRDPFGGRADLDRGLVRAVGDPAARFREDRLRILRALRFASRFRFTIAPETWDAAVAQAGDTGHLSAERVREEWTKGLLTAADPGELVEKWLASGVAAVWLPELRSARQPGTRSDDVVRLTAFYCTGSATVWRRLKGSTAEIRRAAALDAGPARPAGMSPATVRRWMATVGSAADDLATLATWRGEDDGWVEVMAGIRARGEATSREGLAVRGDDLMAAGIPAGPALGAVIQRLLDIVLEDPSQNTRDRLLTLARSA